MLIKFCVVILYIHFKKILLVHPKCEIILVLSLLILWWLKESLKGDKLIGSNRAKSNIAIDNWQSFWILGAPIFFRRLFSKIQIIIYHIINIIIIVHYFNHLYILYDSFLLRYLFIIVWNVFEYRKLITVTLKKCF